MKGGGEVWNFRFPPKNYLFENKYVKQRLEKAQLLKDLNKNPYENQVSRDCFTTDFFKKFEYLKDTESRRDESLGCRIIGRIKFLRLMGKAAFMKTCMLSFDFSCPTKSFKFSGLNA